MAKATDKKKDNAADVQNVQKEGDAGMKVEAPVQEQGKEAETVENGTEKNDAPVSGEKQEKEETDGAEKPEAEGSGSVETGKMILTARTYILHNAHQYKPGEILPANNPDMVAAWLDAGTAAWLPVQEQQVKASPVSAMPGLAGAVSGAVPMSALAERVPAGGDLDGR